MIKIDARTKKRIPSKMKVAKMSVDIVDFMGTDLSVVNAARVSFNKFHEFWEPGKDDKLIKYLAEHNHWSPFSHCFLSFRVKAPIFVARQLAKHQVGLSWNEVSRRYVDDEPEFFFPEVWRGKPVNAKQGSDGVFDKKFMVEGNKEIMDVHSNSLCLIALELYNRAVYEGVAPEQARMILPQNTMTEWIWSGSLYAFARVCNLRLDSHSQQETREVAEKIYVYLKTAFPVSTEHLVKVVDNVSN